MAKDFENSISEYLLASSMHIVFQGVAILFAISAFLDLFFCYLQDANLQSVCMVGGVIGFPLSCQ